MKHLQRSQVILLAVFSFCLIAPAVSQTCRSHGCLCFNIGAICKRKSLTGIPQDLPRGLTFLDMTGNEIVYLDRDDLSRYPDLTTLNLSGNKLIFISSKAFEATTKLTALDLQENRLLEIHSDTFNALSSLQELYLSGNNLTELSEGMFMGLEDLRTLFLGENKLTNIPLSAVKPLKSLERMEITGNQLHCDCNLAWMKNYVPLKNALNAPVVCTSPPSLSGVRLNDIELESLNCAAPTVEPASPIVLGFKGQLSVELRCEASGDPPPKFKWFFHGQELSDSIHYRLPVNGSLLIVTMVPQLAGEYSCLAENIMGNASIQVTLEYAGARLPSFIVRPTDMHQFEGDDFSLECVVDQFADEVHWEKDDTEISSSERVFVLAGGVLQILNAEVEDSGTYTCVAVNEEGPSRSLAFVNVTGPLLSCGGILSREDVDRLKLMVELAVNATQLRLKNVSHSPSALLRRLKFPQGGLIRILKAAEIFDQAISVIRSRLLNSNQAVETGTVIPRLSECEVRLLSELSGCESHKRASDCSSCFHRKYRTIDGTCNNLDYPMRGASEIPFIRLLPPEYEDGIGLPSGWSSSKPSARMISQQVIAAKDISPSERFTLMLMQVGQFLDHDLDIAPMSPSGIVFNTTQPNNFTSCDDICYNDAPCFPIQVPENDPRIQRQCLPFTRSSAVCGTGAASLLIGDVGIHREQLNGITSYIDGSNIYGSTNLTASSLRTLDGTGRLRRGISVEGFPNKYFLPFDNNSLVECSIGVHENRSDCFLGGDMRVNEQVGLTTMHTLFFREHNRVVKKLTDLNSHWDGEKLYQEARRIVVAEWQNIIYSEYLPKILSNRYSAYQGYNSSVDATIANAFATAAYRFGHSQIMPLFPRLDENYQPASTGPLRLQDAFFAPFRLLEEGGIDPLVRGLISSPVKLRASHQGLNNNLTEALFNQAHEISLDLAALNIQRGRDHGLPNYNRWRVYCGLSEAQTISDLHSEISNPTVRTRLREVYGDDPNNIDLWVGGLVEDTIADSQLGPTFHCIINDQFQRLRDGDRFYFERQGQFTPDQMVQLRQASLSRIICDNADNISRVPLDAFVLQSSTDFVSCSDVPEVHLQLWQECSDCDGACESADRSKRSTNHYNELGMRVAIMEKKLGFCIRGGQYHENEDTWTTADCAETCTCKGGAVDCTTLQCPECESPVWRDGECCPVCTK